MLSFSTFWNCHTGIACFGQVLVVFVGSTQTKDNEQIPLPDAVAGLITKGVEIIPVAMGKKFDPKELKAIASDPKAVFPQDAVDPLKRAVKKAALSPPIDRFPGKMLSHLCLPKIIFKTGKLYQFNN